MGSDGSNVFGARTFGAAPFRVRHFLTFSEVLETRALHVRGMKEEVFLFAGIDESESAVGEPLNFAFRHSCVPGVIVGWGLFGQAESGPNSWSRINWKTESPALSGVAEPRMVQSRFKT